MQDPRVRPATLDDVRYLAPRLRRADKDEILAVTGAPAPLVLPECFRLSRSAWTCTGFSGEPVGLIGVQDVEGIPELGWVWALFTDIIERHPFTFLRASQQFNDIVHQHHPIITNLVDERNTVHIRWLRWMGFSFLRRIERWGAEGRPFIEFGKLKSQCA